MVLVVILEPAIDQSERGGRCKKCAARLAKMPKGLSGREALTRLEHAIRLNPFHPDWYIWGLGMAQYLEGNFREACASLGRMSQPNERSKAFEIATLARLGEAERMNEEVVALQRLVPDARAGDLVAALGFRSERVRDELADTLRAAGVPD